ncbi:MAG: hypothetical protein V4850_14720 [Myxococcota bacterium]
MFVLLALLVPGVAQAADAADPVLLDVTRALALSNAELVSMGGAGVAYAAGGAGLFLSPAAPANRRMEATAPVITSLLLLQTSIAPARDVGNLGEPLGEDGRLFSLALSGGYQNVAGGLLTAGAWYATDDLWVGTAEGHASAAVSLFEGQLTLGIGPRFLGMRVTANGEPRDYLGIGVETGAVLANWRDSWNVGVTLRSGVSAGPTDGAAGGIAAARIAPELIVGLGWSNRSYLRDYQGGIPVRFVADVQVNAPVANSVSLEKVLQGEEVTRGGWYTAAPRIGAEVDVWPSRLRLRAGAYLEPSRTSLTGPRPHATGGFEVRLFRLKAFNQRIKLDLAWQVGVDYAPRYFRGAFLGINIWQEGQVGGQYKPNAPRGELIEVQ